MTNVMNQEKGDNIESILWLLWKAKTNTIDHKKNDSGEITF